MSSHLAKTDTWKVRSPNYTLVDMLCGIAGVYVTRFALNVTWRDILE